MIKEAIAKAAGGQDLSEEEMVAAMEQIMRGKATPAQIGALLMALRIKGETLAEISGAARVMRAMARPVPTEASSAGGLLVDVVGTGGDNAGTFNVSTTTAFVVAGCGLKVAKHGGRAVSSRSGSADLIEALGIPLDLTPRQIGACIDRVGIGFLFAPALHEAMRHAVGPRREIGLRTVFNLLGPLTNPAGANTLLVGVYSAGFTTPLAQALSRLGVERAMVVHGLDGLDELSISGPSQVSHLKGGEIEEYQVTPEECGLARASIQDIQGGTPGECLAITRQVLQGEQGPCRDMVLLNAAAALVVAQKAADLREGVMQAAQAIDSGAALGKLRGLVDFARRQSREAA